MTRQDDLRQVDAQVQELMPRAMDGDSGATQRVIELIEHRARIAGWLQPVRLQVEVLPPGATPLDVVQSAIDRLAQEIATEDPA